MVNATSELKSDLHSKRRELLLVLASLLIQVPLAYFLGHYYDQRISMATGYIVGSGGDPYKPIELVGVFSNPLLNGFVSTIGYPPLWPLVLGFIFRLSYGLVSDVFVYNFATKIPMIIANVALAYLVRLVLLNLKVEKKKVNGAWLFLLFNPFLILTTSAWGQTDSLVAVLCIASFYALSKDKTKQGAFLLALSIAIKPVAIALIPLPLLFPERLLSRKNFIFACTFAITLVAFAAVPFALLGWNIPSAPADLTGRFGLAGGMTVFNVAEIIQNSPVIPPSLWFLGFLWMPALLVGYFFVYRNPPRSMNGLVVKSIGLVLIFFLTRSWLSEPNLNLVLPLIVIAVGIEALHKRSLHLVWTVPLVFIVLNAAFPQLFFLVYPSVLDSLAQFDMQFGMARFVARFAIAALWWLLGWKIAFKMLRETD